MLNCREVTELVTDYVEGRLTTWERVRFQVHLAMCADCREYVRQMEATREAVGELPPAALPPELEGRMVELFREWRAGGTPRDPHDG